MQINDLKPAPGSVTRAKKVGRGPGSGHGKTSGRGHKGNKARGQVTPAFEGGQTPLHRRLPHIPGFKAVNKTVWAIVNVGDLDAFEEGTEITPELLLTIGFAQPLLDVAELLEDGSIALNGRAMRKHNLGGLKVLGDGMLSKKLTVRAHKFSKTAVQKIEAAGGAAETLGG